MGLDQNWIVKTEESIHYHRKFNALQGFMANEWYQAGNDVNEEFNCQNLEITSEILDRLEAALVNDTLNPVNGFFFGSSAKDDWYWEQIKELKETVIPDVRDRMEQGERIYYSAWY